MKGKPNVSIIILDTLKLDMFNTLVDSNPNLLKGFDAVRFDNCISPASWTLPSHASLFTGLDQSEHGCHETKTVKSLDIEQIRLRKRTILEDLKENGYATYGISANPYIHPVYGFEGFDKYIAESYFTDIFGSVIEISNSLKPKVSKYRNLYGSDILKLTQNIAKEDPKLFLDLALSATMLTPKAAVKKLRAKLIDGWPLEKGGKNILKTIRNIKFKKPFFLFVNFMEAHDPYVGAKGKDFNWVTPFLKKETDPQLMRLWERLYEKASIRAMKYGTELIRGSDQEIRRQPDNNTHIRPWPTLRRAWVYWPRHSNIRRGDTSATACNNAERIQQKPKGKRLPIACQHTGIHRGGTRRRCGCHLKIDQRKRMRRDVQHTRKYSKHKGR